MSLLPDAASLLELALRATALLGGALLIDRLLRGAPAVTRHGLWAATTLALLALPMLHAQLPRLPIPGWTTDPPAPASVARVMASVDVIPAAGVPAVAVPVRTPAVAPPPWVRPSVRQMLAALWAVVLVAITVSIVRGVLRARRLLRAAVVVTAPRLLARLAHAQRLTGVRRQVRLACAEQVRTPMTGGLWRPTILVPHEALAWPEDLLDTVLRHELIHIRRHDALHQLLSRCSVALYWCHPLSWRAAARAARAREEACDEAVLALGTRPSHYARHLVALAGGGTVAPLLPALARLHHPTLEDRVITILRTRSVAATPRRTLFALTGLLGWTVLVAAAGPAAAQRPAEPPAVAEAPGAPAPPATRQVAARLAAPPPAAPSAPAAPAAPAPPHAPAAPMPPAAPVASDCEFGASGRVAVRSSAVDRGPVRTIQRDLGERAICLAIRGPLPETTALLPLPALPAGVVITMAARGEDGVQRLVITGSPSGNQHEWRVNDAVRPFDREAMAWRDAMLEVMALSGEQGRAHVTAARHHAEVAAVQGEAAAVQAELATAQARQHTVRARAVAEVRAASAATQARVLRDVEVRQAQEVHAEARARALTESEAVRAERGRAIAEVEVADRAAQERQRVREARSLREAASADRRAVVRERAAVAEAGRRAVEVEARRAADATSRGVVERRAAGVLVERPGNAIDERLVTAEYRLAELIDRIGGR